MKIVFTGGGTGGHTFPLIAVARELNNIARERKEVLDLVFMGHATGTEELMRKNGIKPIHISTEKFRRYFSFHYLLVLPKIIIGFIQAYIYLLWHMPDVIFSKGGYGSFPVVVVGWLFKIPVITHESDAISGMANRVMARFCKKIIVSFPGEYPKLPSEKIVHIGNPVRNFSNIPAPMEAKKILGISSQKPVIFIMGGSQGAQQINTLIVSILEKIVQEYEVIHVTGKDHFGPIKEYANRLPANLKNSYHPHAFLEEEQLKLAYSASDLVISRAGAGAIFEIASVGRASILIPLAGSAYGHQQKNAQTYQATGACIALDAGNLTDDFLMERISSITKDPQKKRAMQEAAIKFSKPNAAKEIAEILVGLNKKLSKQKIIKNYG
ncbi:MAG: undecaprenyldiphospho-muramoylpentapeptide beta-N-acetylglucosaminyltransferase [Candidatus Spechtbacterales bacterium]|nr:undecaprenyldiphospho-muramoylpentapeptide beta-N-acetylglucosaminyltransferase [Candidatus Spechtbacterales bacterium]